MEELKPCPFCGSTELKRRGNSDIEYMNGYIECIKCHAYGPSANSSALGTAKTSEEVWNARAEQVDTMPLPLDADGVPIRIGETLFIEIDGDIFSGEVNEMASKGEDGWSISLDNTDAFSPKSFSHKPPDSWEKLEEDARKQTTCDYACSNIHALEDFDHIVNGCCSFNDCNKCAQTMALDLIARAKRLAGVE